MAPQQSDWNWNKFRSRVNSFRDYIQKLLYVWLLTGDLPQFHKLNYVNNNNNNNNNNLKFSFCLEVPNVYFKLLL